MKRTGNVFFYRLLRGALFIAYKIFFRFEHYGSERVPYETDRRGVILAPNHVSFLDPPTLGISLQRPVTFLAKEYLFKAFFVGWVLRSIGAFPIKTKSDDFRTVRGLIRILKEGRCLVVFPEGTRSVDGQFREPESGAGFLAAKSKAWIVPTYIEGTFEAFPKGERFFKCRKVKIAYGHPFLAHEDAGLVGSADPYAAISRRIMKEIENLKQDVAGHKFDRDRRCKVPPHGG